MKTNHILLLGLAASSLLAASALAGCGNSATGSGGAGGASSSTTTSTSTSTTTSTSTSTTTSSTGGGDPLPPTLGAQLDRFGRPAINTALNHTFDTTAAKGPAKDTYNADDKPAMWSGTYGPEFAKNLAILDSLDTNCGNQLLAGPNPVAGRYSTLAGALADDRVWLKTDAAMCTTYLAVEANATGILKNADCGGRKLDYDVIDASYSALAAGALMGVGDGIAADADTKGTMFPYLAAPH